MHCPCMLPDSNKAASDRVQNPTVCQQKCNHQDDIQTNDRLERVAMPDHVELVVHRDFKEAYSPLIDNAAARAIEIEQSRLSGQLRVGSVDAVK